MFNRYVAINKQTDSNWEQVYEAFLLSVSQKPSHSRAEITSAHLTICKHGFNTKQNFYQNNQVGISEHSKKNVRKRGLNTASEAVSRSKSQDVSLKVLDPSIIHIKYEHSTLYSSTGETQESGNRSFKFDLGQKLQEISGVYKSKWFELLQDVYIKGLIKCVNYQCSSCWWILLKDVKVHITSFYVHFLKADAQSVVKHGLECHLTDQGIVGSSTLGFNCDSFILYFYWSIMSTVPIFVHINCNCGLYR